jgi:hypothetical protein
MAHRSHRSLPNAVVGVLETLFHGEEFARVLASAALGRSSCSLSAPTRLHATSQEWRPRAYRGIAR